MQMALTGLVSRTILIAISLSPLHGLVLGAGLPMQLWLVDPKELNSRSQGFLLRRKC